MGREGVRFRARRPPKHGPRAGKGGSRSLRSRGRKRRRTQPAAGADGRQLSATSSAACVRRATSANPAARRAEPTPQPMVTSHVPLRHPAPANQRWRRAAPVGQLKGRGDPDRGLRARLAALSETHIRRDVDRKIASAFIQVLSPASGAISSPVSWVPGGRRQLSRAG